MAVKIGSYTVPPKLETVAQWAKFIVAVAALVAGVAIHLFTGLPAWVLLIPAVAGTLGVGVVPNGTISSEISSIETVVKDGELAYSDAKHGDTSGAVDMAKTAEVAAAAAVWSAKVAAKGIEPSAQAEPASVPLKGVQDTTKRPSGPTKA